MIDAHTSEILRACEQSWAIIRRFHPEVPADVMFTLSSRGRQSKRGHWWVGQWAVGEAEAHEVWISAQRLADGADGVLDTLVHEAAHALNFARDEQGTDKSGRRHNKVYKAAAEEMGLAVEKSKNYGFAHTTLTDEGKDTYKAAYQLLHKALRAYRKPEASKAAASKQRLLKAMCECGGIVRASAAVFEKCSPVCSDCNTNFEVTG